MNKKKILKGIGLFLIPIIIGVALYSQSTNLFKGSLTDIMGEPNYSVELSFPNTNLTLTNSVAFESKGSLGPIYIDQSQIDSYQLVYATNRNTTYTLSVISSDIPATESSIQNGNLSFASGQTILKEGQLNNIKFIQDASGNNIAIEKNPQTASGNLEFINWGLNCRYDTLNGELIPPTEFTTCDSNLYHYLKVNVFEEGTSQEKQFILPIIFENPLSVDWNFLGVEDNNFISIAETSNGANSTTALYKEALNLGLWEYTEGEHEETLTFTPSLSNYNYSIKLIQKDTSFYEVWTEDSSSFDTLRPIHSDNNVNGTSSYNWEVYCEAGVCDPSKFQALEIQIESRETGNDSSKKFIFPLKNQISEPEISFLAPYVENTITNWPSINITNPETTNSNGKYLNNPINIDKTDFIDETTFIFSNNANYTYEVLFTQNADTDDTQTNIDNLTNSLINGSLTSSRSLFTSLSEENGLSEFTFNENCVNSAGASIDCNLVGYTNYLIFKITSNYPNPEADLEGEPATLSQIDYRVFPLTYSAPADLYLQIENPIQVGPIITNSSSSETLNINLEDSENFELEFYTNQNLNYSLDLKTQLADGETTITNIANNQSSNAYTLTTSTWNKICGDPVPATDTVEAHPKCDEFLDDTNLFLELKLLQDSSEVLTYKIPVNLHKEFNLIWQNPFLNKDNSDFIQLTYTPSDEEADFAYLYPYKLYVNLDEASSVKFNPTHPESEFSAKANFVYLNTGQTYETNFLSRESIERITSTNSSLVGENQNLDFAWDKSCDDTDSCLDSRFSSPAIEILVTNLGNTSSYIFPLSFEEQDTPIISVNSPVSDAEGELPILAANTSSTSLDISTDIPAICRANTSGSTFEIDDDTNLDFTANNTKTNHTLNVSELENQSTYTYFIKCFNPNDPNKVASETISFRVDKDYLNLTWQNPSASQSDFELSHDDATQKHSAIYNNTLSINSNTSGTQEFSFTATNDTISYNSYIASLALDTNLEEYLSNIPDSTPSGFKSLSAISTNAESDYAGTEISANTNNTINWDKQCYDLSNSSKTACSPDNLNVFLIKIETQAKEAVLDDPATTEVDESREAIPSETYWYFFELSIGDDPVITSCTLSGDEVIYNHTTEDLVFSFSAETTNIDALEATISLEKSDGSQIGEIYNGDLSGNSGEFTWNGQVNGVAIANNKYTSKLRIEDKNSSQYCETTWNFLANDTAPFVEGEFTISLSEPVIVVDQTTSTVSIHSNKDSFRTIVNVYDNNDTGIATIYKCIAGEDTASVDTPCPRDVSFEWDGSHQMNFLNPGKYYLRGTMQDLNGKHILGLSNDFMIKLNLTPDSAYPTSTTNTKCSEYFVDVAPNNPACAAISYVKEAGIFKGTDRGTIELNSAISRLEMITVTNRIKESLNPDIFSNITEYHPVRDGNMGFSDLDPYVNKTSSKWFMDEIWKATQAQLIQGYSDGTVRPNDYITGPESFKLIQLSTEVNSSTHDTKPWYLDYLTFNYVNNLNTAGINENSQAVTRGQIIEYIYSIHMAGLY